jgi:hypothetical protein
MIHGRERRNLGVGATAAAIGAWVAAIPAAEAGTAGDAWAAGKG